MGVGTTALDEVGFWVDAAPFRAQLHHLMGGTGLTLGEVAAAAGISVRLAEHLAYGRNGRALRRVSQETGRRLMCLSVAQLRRRGAVPLESPVRLDREHAA